MKTIVVKIEDVRGRGAKAGYPLHLFVEDTTKSWWKEPRASGTIPKSLDDPALPVDENGQRLARKDVIAFLLAQTDVSPTFLRYDLKLWMGSGDGSAAYLPG